MQFSVAGVLLLTPALVLAQGDVPSLAGDLAEERRPFDQGDMEAALQLGLGSGSTGTRYFAGLGFAYYVLPGLAPGIDVTVHGGTDIATQTWTLLPLKWVLYRSYDFAPYVVVEGGRIFIASDEPDLWIVGAGPGFHLFSSRSVGLKAQLVFYRLFPKDRCEGFADGCDSYLLGLGIGIVL